jgi:hypothetical protein
VSRAVGLVERAEGNVFVFDAAPRGKDTEARLEQLFTADREEEWTEFLAECAKFDQRMDKEIPRSSPLPSSTRRSRTWSVCAGGSATCALETSSLRRRRRERSNG